MRGKSKKGRLLRRGFRLSPEREKKMKWFLVDDCTTKKSALFTEELRATTREDAEKEIQDMWDRLTDHDKKLRDDFYGVYGDDPMFGEEFVYIRRK